MLRARDKCNYAIHTLTSVWHAGISAGWSLLMCLEAGTLSLWDRIEAGGSLFKLSRPQTMQMMENRYEKLHKHRKTKPIGRLHREHHCGTFYRLDCEHYLRQFSMAAAGAIAKASGPMITL